MHEKVSYNTLWTLRKYADDNAFRLDRPFSVVDIDGNMLLTAGITALWNLLIAAGGTAFNNANARIGVGDSSTAELPG